MTLNREADWKATIDLFSFSILFFIHMSQRKTHAFQAEIKQLLDIVIHSLYTNKEIFIRELISNAADALEKLRHLRITEKAIQDDHLDLEINITTDATAGTFTIQDFGVGMSQEELIENLGTIAHSGSKAFLEALKQGAAANNESLIGQFGVGFYSVFMVAKEVRVHTHSWEKSVPGACWSSDGLGTYTVEPSTGQRRGCKIIVALKDEAKTFSEAETVKRIIQRYSSFVPFPIHLNGERINTAKALWLQNKTDIKDDDYKAFYKFQSNAYDEPMSWLHFNADAPLAINALLFIPQTNLERFGFTERIEPAAALHCRKILIEAHPRKLLPEWLRFLKGVVDSADLPLNISRETLQDSQIVQKLNQVLTKRVIKHLEEMAQKNPDTYKAFWSQFGVFIKEGIIQDSSYRKSLAKLLRFETSLSGQRISLSDYLARMQKDQKAIYFLSGPNREALEASPYLEPFKAHQIEVLFLYEPIDAFVMQHLDTFEEKKLQAGDQRDLDLDALPIDPTEEPLAAETVTALCKWMQGHLGERVEKVVSSERLVNSPAVAFSSSPLPLGMQRMLRLAEPHKAPQPLTLEINPRHALIKKLTQYHESHSTLAQQILDQIFDNTLIAAGLLDDPKPMVARIYKLLEAVGPTD